MTSIAQAIAAAADRLGAAGVPADEAAGDAEVLARHLLDWDLTTYTLHRHEAASADFAAALAQAVARRARREPVSHIVGRREFWGLDFEVNADVLTPRPETEVLVQAALDVAPRDRPIVVVEVGTGSGCIAIALAKELPLARVIAVDVSPAALAVAARNVAAHGVHRRVELRLGNLLDGIVAADLVVSNPPYIADTSASTLPPEVREYEPHVALFGGSDGLDVYRRLFRDARALTKRLVVEVGYDEAAAVSALAAAAGWSVENTQLDLRGVERVLSLMVT